MNKKIHRFSGKDSNKITPSQLLAQALEDVDSIDDIVIIRREKETGDVTCSISNTTNESLAYKKLIFDVQVNESVRREFFGE